MELKTLFGVLRKWLWLLILGGFLMGGAAFVVSSMQPNKYQASVTVAVGTTLKSPNPDSSFISTGAELARTYVILATTREVLDAAIGTGTFPITGRRLREIISARVIEGTALVTIGVTYTDPYLAAELANAVAHQLILNSPSYLTEEQQAQLDLADAEIANLNAELKEARDEVKALDAALLIATDIEEIRSLREQRYTLAAIINEKSANIAEFSATIADFQQRSNSLNIVESAVPPVEPIGLGLLPATLAGAMLGVATATGVALAIDYFDDTVTAATDAAELLRLPILGSIIRFGRWRTSYEKCLVASRDPDGPATEGYRALRTNLLFLSNSDSKHTAYIITSPGASEGKTLTAANLAVVMAHAGLRVLLIDADLRNPSLHRVFDLENGVGLSTLALTVPLQSPLGEYDSLVAHNHLNDAIQSTGIPGLRVITSGPPPLNPAELLGSEAMRQWICQIQLMSDIDLLLIDTPPVLYVTDATALAASGNLPIVLVIRARKTRIDAAIKAKEQLDLLETRVVGIVINDAKPKERSYYYRYGA